MNDWFDLVWILMVVCLSLLVVGIFCGLAWSALVSALLMIGG